MRGRACARRYPLRRWLRFSPRAPHNWVVGRRWPSSRAQAANANAAVGEGQVRVALILPLSAQGNAAVAAQSMKNAAEMALAEFKSPEHSAAGEGRWRHVARRASRRPAGHLRGRRDHHRSALRAIGQRGRTGCALTQHSGDRVFHRCQRGGARRLFVELPARDRRPSHRRFCYFARQTLVRRAVAGQCLRHGGGRRIPARSVASRWPRAGAGKISARREQDE